MLRRVFRDLGILGIFCAIFWGFISLINLLGEEKSGYVASEFSVARKTSDNSLARKDYTGAIASLTEQTEVDPFNSHAWYRLGQCYWRMYSLEVRPAFDDPSTEISQEKLSELSDLADKAIAALNKSADYPRYRINSLLMNAALFAHQDEPQNCVKQLETTLEHIEDVSDSRFLHSPYFESMNDNRRFAVIKASFDDHAAKRQRNYRARTQYRSSLKDGVKRNYQSVRDLKARRGSQDEQNESEYDDDEF